MGVPLMVLGLKGKLLDYTSEGGARDKRWEAVWSTGFSISFREEIRKSVTTRGAPAPPHDANESKGILIERTIEQLDAHSSRDNISTIIF